MADLSQQNGLLPRSITAESRYEALSQERAPYLTRARECSRLTIPSLLPPEGASGATTLYQPYQSVGADGVNNLAAKLLMVLFPPGAPFFRLTMDDFVVEQLSQNANGEDARAEFEAALGKTERAVVTRREQKGSRKVDFEALQHLIVTGNGLIHVLKDGSQKFFPLDRYVVSRDLDDNVMEIIVKETIARDALPKKVLDVLHNMPQHEAKESGKAPESEVDVYTWVQRRQNGSWSVHQEVCGVIIPGSNGSYPKDKSAWLPLRWTRISGESYGRGRCEEYLGDLVSLEALTKAIVQFSAAVSKIVMLVNEGGVTDKVKLAKAESGDVLDGDAKDVSFLMVEKAQDFQVAKAVADETKQRLERAFLMASSVQRQAERVTAEEIRVMVGELEQGLGGVYSILSEEYQRPLVARLLHQLSQSKENRIPKLPEGTVSPQIVTGLDGLGRNSDLQRLDALIAGVGQTFGNEAVARWFNVGSYLTRKGASLGIDMTGLVKTQEQIDAEDQQRQMAALAEKAAGPMVNAMSAQALASNENQPPTE